MTPQPYRKDQKGRPYFSSLALPYNFAFPFTIGSSLATGIMHGMGISKKTYPEILKNLLHSGLEALTPMPQENSLIGKMTPALAVPFTHIAINENFYGAPLHAKAEPWNAGVPHAEQGRRDTGEFWKSIASGGEKAGLDLYPEDYREVLGFFTSSLTNLYGRSAAAARAVASGKNPEPTDVPLLHVITAGGRQFDAADRAQYYHQREEAYAAANQLRALTKKAALSRDYSAMQAFQKANAGQIDAASVFKSATKEIGALHQQMDQIQAGKGMDQDHKDAKIDALRSEEAKIQSRTRAQARRLTDKIHE